MTKSKKIVFFGNERLATGVTTNTPVVSSLVNAGYDIVAIVVTPQSSSPSRKPRMLEIAAFAADHDIPLVEISQLKPAVNQLRNYQADAGVLAAFGKIVPQEVIDIFPAGIINIHPSLLPKHRGPTPIESPILEGETETGVSLMKLVAAMDAGPVYDQQRISLSGEEDKQQLADTLGEMGAQRLVELLPAITDGKLKPIEQDGSATYDQKIGQEASILDFNKPAIRLEREIRAYAGWPRSKTSINSQPVIITKAHVVNELSPAPIWQKDNMFGFATSDGVLAIDKLIPAGSKEMTAADYLRGHRL